MKTIIVPLDFSNESLPGLYLSMMLAKKTGAKIQLVHVILKNDSTTDELLKKQHKMAKRKFKDLLKKFKEKNKLKFDLSYSIKDGKIFKEVTDLGAKIDDSLIVLSTHGESGFEDLFIGGNAYKITSHSNPKSEILHPKSS